MRYRVWRVGIPFLVVGAVAALGWVVMVLWNNVVPGIFVGARVLDYWHAVGLLVLSRILFGGFRGRGRGRGGWRDRRWRRWETMTPEERDQLRQKYSARCGRREERA